MKNSATRIVAVLLAGAALVLAGCSSSGDNAKPDPKASATLPKEIQNRLTNNQAVAPNQYKIEKQDDLASSCKDAVEPVRVIMRKAGGLVTKPEAMSNIGTLLDNARKDCTAQEFAEWYGYEFNSWLSSTDPLK